MIWKHISAKIHKNQWKQWDFNEMSGWLTWSLYIMNVTTYILIKLPNLAFNLDVKMSKILPYQKEARIKKKPWMNTSKIEISEREKI